MSTEIDLFLPFASTSLSVTTSSARVALPGTFTSAQRRTVRLYNAGATAVHVAFGDSSVTAATDGTCVVIPPGYVETFYARPGATYVAGIAAASLTLYISAGTGA